MKSSKKNEIEKNKAAANVNSTENGSFQLVNNRAESISQQKNIQLLKNSSRTNNTVAQLEKLPTVPRTALPSSHAVDDKHWDTSVFPYAPDERVRKNGGTTLYPRELCKGNRVQDAWGYYNRVSDSSNWTAQGTDRYVHEDWDDDVKVKVVIAHDAAEKKQTLVTTYPTDGRNTRAVWDKTAEDAESDAHVKVKITTSCKTADKVKRTDSMQEWIDKHKDEIEVTAGFTINNSNGVRGKKNIYTTLTFATRAKAVAAKAALEGDKKPVFGISTELAK